MDWLQGKFPLEIPKISSYFNGKIHGFPVVSPVVSGCFSGCFPRLGRGIGTVVCRRDAQRRKAGALRLQPAAQLADAPWGWKVGEKHW
jgi:hypothetical protein